MNKLYLFLSISLLTASCAPISESPKKKTEETIEKKNEITLEKPIENLEVSIQKELVTVSDTIRAFDSVMVWIRQTEPSGDNSTYYTCQSYIKTYYNQKLVDSLNFKKIDAVGGYSGLSHPYVLENHLVVNKHGDYDGRTIIINNVGTIFNISGGTNYIDKEEFLLFTIINSDISGVVVFDLGLEKTFWSMEEMNVEPLSIYKEFGNRYFLKCYDHETDTKGIWELEFDQNRIVKVDLDTDQFNLSNQLFELDSETYN